MENENLRIVEINGVKIEVDLRTAKRVDHFKIGDHVKLLVKEYSSYKLCSGIIVGFDEFKELPTIIVAYLSSDYQPELKMAYINSKTEGFEIAPTHDLDLQFDRDTVLTRMDNIIEDKKREVQKYEKQKENFIKLFGKFFESPVKSVNSF